MMNDSQQLQPYNVYFSRLNKQDKQDKQEWGKKKKMGRLDPLLPYPLLLY